MQEALKAKNEVKFNLDDVHLFEYCPKCGKPLTHAWQQTRNYDDSNPVRYCNPCDTAWIWLYPGAN